MPNHDRFECQTAIDSDAILHFHLCRAKDKYPVRIDHVIHYSDKSAVDGLRYALSYLAKQDQKEHGIILGRSRLPEKSNRGRPRHN